jgi:hypothetical protein
MSFSRYLSKLGQLLNSSGQVTVAGHADGSVTPVKLSSDAQFMGFKNRIINGAMVIDQRNAGASIPNTGNPYCVDRWQAVGNQSAKYTVQQSSTAPTGFSKSLAVTSSSAYSVGSGDFFYVRQQIEGYNVADFNLGTATASTFTLSFWVRSSLTGTFGGTFANGDSDSVYPFTYTISSANTWEQKTITVTGRTSGTWNTTNGTGLYVLFALGTGSTYSGTANAWTSSLALGVTGQTSVVGTSGATFYITGVQLEKGSTATSFDYRPYGTELALCQRYYYRMQPLTALNIVFGSGYADATTRAIVNTSFPVVMRSTPTVGFYGTPSAFGFAVPTGTPTCTSTTVYRASPYQMSNNFYCSGGGLTAGWGLLIIDSGNVNAYIDATSEL